MIISERLLFKGLADESPASNQDRLFDRGHAFAVSVAIGFSAIVLFGLAIVAG